MTTSVVLEGQVTTVDDSYHWKGVWRFAKDKKGTLQFEYEKFSHEIPPDLLDYVSFMDPTSLALNQSDSQHHKSKKGRRGRPPIASAMRSITAPSSSEHQPPSHHSAQLTTDPSPNEGGEQMEDLAALDSSMDAERDANNSYNINDSNDRGDNMNDEELLRVENREPAVIPQTHPLLGLWKGRFAVHGAKGEDFAEETLFFHSVLGQEVLPQFKDLPPEPSFPFGLLKNHNLNGIKVPGLGEHDADASDPSKRTYSVGSESEVLAGPGAGSGAENSGAETVTAMEGDVGDNEAGDNVDDHSRMLASLYKHVLVGFGRNAIGRFSVAALYDETQCELRCEKKYMNTKFAIKRGRRSHAEYALSYGYNANSNGSQAATNPMVTRQSDSGQTADEAGRVHRSAYHNNYYINNAHKFSEVSDVELPPTKRKRSNSTRVDYLAALGTRASKQELAQYIAEQYADHPLALVGSRNPDNDEVTEGFRDAFMDMETGEVYEGQWSGGLRHGYGVCVYNDGLMYEGQWIRGKEHGKGLLMTGDRRVIYSGDWLDGMMHGAGEYHYGNGDVYIGDFKEGNRHGRGEYMSAETKCVYSGDWRENKRHGKGRFNWPDGSFYDGEWENDRRSGRGILELADGFRYDGSWLHNVMEGKGVCTYAPSGQTYQGTFKAGLRDGRGSVFFPEGDAVYEGRFKEDRFDGQGTIKINSPAPGAKDDEVFIPIQIQPDFWRIHWKAGFGNSSH